MKPLKCHLLNIRVLISLLAGAGLGFLFLVLWMPDMPTILYAFGEQSNASVLVNILHVSQCGGNLDDRRLGNQLFNFAALLYAVHGLNKDNSGYRHAGNYRDIRGNLKASAADGVRGVRANWSTQLQAYFYAPSMPYKHPHGWMDRWFDVDVMRFNTSKGDDLVLFTGPFQGRDVAWKTPRVMPHCTSGWSLRWFHHRLVGIVGTLCG